MLLVGCGIITVNGANDWINTSRFITKLLSAHQSGLFSLFLKKKEHATKLLEWSIVPSVGVQNITERGG